MGNDPLAQQPLYGGLSRGSWLTLAGLLVVLFVLLSASEALLSPILGQVAVAADYLHEIAHDGRHLLAVSCH